jgi:hypothetical protein
MADEPFYAPSRKPPAPAPPRPQEPLWTLRKRDRQTACALVHGEYGVEAVAQPRRPLVWPPGNDRR